MEFESAQDVREYFEGLREDAEEHCEEIISDLREERDLQLREAEDNEERARIRAECREGIQMEREELQAVLRNLKEQEKSAIRSFRAGQSWTLIQVF